jgi:SH3-like domain-containing protein
MIATKRFAPDSWIQISDHDGHRGIVKISSISTDKRNLTQKSLEDKMLHLAQEE